MTGNPVIASDWKGPAFRQMLVRIVRKRVPECDVEDIVQATLAEALSPSAPPDEPALQRWLIGVARHKIADRHRRGRRESFELPELPVDAAPHSEEDLVRWAERELPAEGEPRRTLEWMLREGEGEKLESIAESEQLPAPRVRKRVSRLRSHLRAQWRKEVALLAALGVVAVLVWVGRRERPPVARDQARPVPSEVVPTARERAAPLREAALAACGARGWAACLDGLDRAKEIDPAGEGDERVESARAAASAANRPAPAPTFAPRPIPTSSAPSPTTTQMRSLPTPPPSKTAPRSDK
jgi:DNA-directed RNA polymerase specialized sigma24 family protein